MLVKRFQNKVAESRISLPITAVYALLVCLGCGFWEQQLWWQFAVLAVSSFLMMELNNANALIRIYSRMVSCSFIAFVMMAKFLLVSLPCGIVQLFFIAFFLFFFKAYQDKRATGTVFYAFAMLGIASTQFVQILYFLPIALVLLFTNILAGTARTLCAALMGVLMPYWFVGGYCIYADKLDALVGHVQGLWTFTPIADINGLDLHQIVTFVLLAFVSVVGMVHFHRNSYKDKIRTRMLFETFTTFNLIIMVFMVLQPQHFNSLLGMLIVCTAPQTGHFISLTNTKLTNATFVVLLFVVMAITVFNIWIQ